MLVIIHMWHIESYLPYRHVHLGIWACTCIRQTWAYMGIWHIWAPYIHMAHLVKHIHMWNMYRYITCEKLINCILENVNLGIRRYTCQTYRHIPISYVTFNFSVYHPPRQPWDFTWFFIPMVETSLKFWSLGWGTSFVYTTRPSGLHWRIFSPGRPGGMVDSKIEYHIRCN